MATANTVKKKPEQEYIFDWEGKDRAGKPVRGRVYATHEHIVQGNLRRQGIFVTKMRRRSLRGGKSIKPKDIAIFTRQMATMTKAGISMLQTFDIIGRSSTNPRISRLLFNIRQSVESGTSLSESFQQHPLYFDDLYCNMIRAGETAGILDSQLNQLAVYMEKIEAIKAKIKTAMIYPGVVIFISICMLALIMIKVIPAFKSIFESANAELPLMTQMVVAVSDFFVENWLIIFGGLGGSIYLFFWFWKRSQKMQRVMDRLLLKLPIFGNLLAKSSIARWARTLAIMFSAGVPLTEALSSVGGSAGNYVFKEATDRIARDVAAGTSLTTAMSDSGVFPVMAVQLCSIGEESGAIDDMLNKAADFYEQEVNEIVARLSALMEPIIIVVLGSVIGFIVVAMYLPLFKLGSVM